MWLAWLLSLIAGQLVPGSGPTDRFGQLIGTDFVAFYTAGRIVDAGLEADLYSLELAHDIQQEIYQVGSANFNPYLNPPFYALLFVPFSRLPYTFAAIAWMALNLVFLWVSIRLLDSGRETPRAFWLALTWLPAWSAITFGQNAFLTLLILSGTFYLWRHQRNFLAGLAAGLMLYKPQLAIGIGLLWLFDVRLSWKNLAGLALSGFGLALFSIISLPKATLAYLTYALRINANLMTFEGFPIWNAHGVQTFFLALLPGMKPLAQGLYLVCAILGVGVFYLFFRQHADSRVRFAGAVCLTLWVTPYVMVYDWSLLIIPAILLWQTEVRWQPALAVLYAILWVVMFVSTALTAAQWQLFGAAIQISVPALALVLMVVLQILGKPQQVRAVNAEPE